MRFLRWLGLALGLLTIAGQLARFGGGAFADVRPWDDLLVGGALLALGVLGARARPAWHVAGWGLFTGVHLTTLVVSLDHWLRLDAKAAGPTYPLILAAITAVGAAATVAAARRA